MKNTFFDHLSLHPVIFCDECDFSTTRDSGRESLFPRLRHSAGTLTLSLCAVAPAFEIRSPLHRLTGGADLSQIDSIDPQAALQIIAEIGTDMSRWPTENHFASWTTFAPNNRYGLGGTCCHSRSHLRS